MVYETITFENTNEFVDSLEIKNKDNFKIDFSHTNFISLLSNDKDDFVRFNINVMYHNTNRNDELMFSKQNLTNFKNKIKLIKTIFDFKKFITSDMDIEFIFVKNNNDLRFNIKLTSNVEGTSKTVVVKATDNAMTYKVAGCAELYNARGEYIEWDFYGETFEIDTTDLTSQEIISKIVADSQAGIAKFDANVKILEQVLNHN
jgi:hypothetical protein